VLLGVLVALEAFEHAVASRQPAQPPGRAVERAPERQMNITGLS
jgi:hypothetical protein